VYQDLVVKRGVASPKPSLIKALLINGAVDLSPAGGCDYTFDTNQGSIAEGWGRVNAKNSLYGPGGSPATRNIEFENEVTANAVATGGVYTRTFSANAGTPAKVTLAWTDYPAAAGAVSPLVVNDLDLEVVDPNGVTYLGNRFTGNWSVIGGSADRHNVVENVYLQSPVTGTYTIKVKGFQVPQDQEPALAGVNQDFSLVWSGSLGAAAPVHDVAVTSIAAPGTVVVNTAQTVTVVVANEGNQTETFTVGLTDNLAATIGADQTVTLNAGASQTLSFSWTPTVTGTHALTGTAATVSGETDTADNTKTTTSTVSDAVHDVAVQSISAPASVAQGTTATVTVVVKNEGDFTESFTVSLADTPPAGGTAGTPSGPQTVSSLAAGATQTLTFTWNTTGATAGAHTLTGTATMVAGETDTADNSKATTSTVGVPPAAPTGLMVTATKPTSISLSWGIVAGASYKIFRCTGTTCTPATQVGTTGVGVTTFTNNGLARRTTYRYGVKASTEFGDSGLSNLVNGTTK